MSFPQVFDSSLALPFTEEYLPKACTCWLIEGLNLGSTLIPTTKLASKFQTPALKREHQSFEMLLAASRTREIFSKL